MFIITGMLNETILSEWSVRLISHRVARYADYAFVKFRKGINAVPKCILTSPTMQLSLLLSSRGVRNDASLVPPIRQTASIFKQPVTIYKMQDGKVKDVKHGTPEKPKQVSSDIDRLFVHLVLILIEVYDGLCDVSMNRVCFNYTTFHMLFV